MDGEIRSNGELATLQIDIDGVERRVAITRDAIEDRLRSTPKDAAAMGVEAQCEFVRQHLPDVIAAVRRRIGVTSETVSVVVIGAGEL